MIQYKAFAYRGMHADHPQIEAARRGIVIPGNVDGTVTPEQHNDDFQQEVSPFTSWSYSLAVAEFHAKVDEPGFVILRVLVDHPPPGAGWSWEDSPDRYGEKEVLLRGIRMNLEVIQDDRPSRNSEESKS